MSRHENHPQTVIISDAHVHERYDNVDAFFAMLRDIRRRRVDVVFLGDVFDLWIALPRYETDQHRRFLAWCRENAKDRMVGFVEGNHEFFVHQSHADCFTWSVEDEKTIERRGWLFAHGDRINTRDAQYLRFRKWTKNPLTKWVVRWFPFGPRWVRALNAGLKKTNQAHRIFFPEDDLRAFAQRKFAAGFSRIFIGHFHRQFCFQQEAGGALWVLPDWLETQHLGLIDARRPRLQTFHWRELPDRLGSRKT